MAKTLKSRKIRRTRKVKGRKHRKHATRRRMKGGEKLVKYYNPLINQKYICKDVETGNIVKNITDKTSCTKHRFQWAVDSNYDGCFYNDPVKGEVKLKDVTDLECRNMNDETATKKYNNQIIESTPP